MREILFRGKRIDNGEWIQGFLVIWGNDYYIAPDINAYTSMGGRGKGRCTMFGHYYQVLPETIGQYTGLTDKNGTKVFEGDIVAIPPNMSRKSTLGVVKFGDYKTPPYGVDKTNRGFYIRWYYENEAIEEMLRRDIVFWFNYSHVDILIIGNIYDNPELLEVKE